MAELQQTLSSASSPSPRSSHAARPETTNLDGIGARPGAWLCGGVRRLEDPASGSRAPSGLARILSRQPRTSRQAPARSRTSSSCWPTTSATASSAATAAASCAGRRRRASTSWPARALRLLNFNVETQCTPSRSALMTGRFPIRSGTMRVNRGGGPYGLTQWEITIAELLSQHGYATGHFGKWHLGDIEGRYPTDQGFDEWYGIPNSTSVSPWTSAAGFDPKVAPVPHILEGRKGEKTREAGSLRPEDAPADRHRDHAPDDRLHEAERAGRQAVLRLRAVHAGPLSDAAAPRLRGQDRPRRLRRLAGRDGPPRRPDPRRGQGAGHREEHHRRLHQRQRAGGDAALARLGRAVVGLVLHGDGRLAARAVHHPLAGQGPGRPREQRDRA